MPALTLLALASLGIWPDVAQAQWSAPAVVPTTATGDAKDSRVGLACNGNAAVMWESSNGWIWVAMRLGGVWESTTFGSGAAPYDLAMNERGDLAIVWRNSFSFCFAFRRAGGAWEASKCFSGETGLGYRVALSLNDYGAVVASWLDEPFFDGEATVVVRAAGATAWPAAESVATGISGVSGAVTVSNAIDNAGNVIVAWMDTYAQFNTTAGVTGHLFGVQTRVRPAASGVWGAVTALTPRPSVDPFAPGMVPKYLTPVLAADPRTGALIAAFPGTDDAVEADPLGDGDDWQYALENNGFWSALGTVAGGLAGKSALGNGRSGWLEGAGSPGGVALAGYFGSSVPGAVDAVAGVALPGGVPGLDTLGPPLFNGGDLPVRAVDIGEHGTAAAVLNGEVWISQSLGSFSGPDDPLPTREVDDVAVNCNGDIFAAGDTAGTVDEETRFTEIVVPPLFEDGFEGGDANAWSGQVGS